MKTTIGLRTLERQRAFASEVVRSEFLRDGVDSASIDISASPMFGEVLKGYPPLGLDNTQSGCSSTFPGVLLVGRAQ